MNKSYYISLQGKIDDSAASIAKLNNQIKQMENKISSLEIKIKTPSNASRGFGDLNTQLNKLKVDMKDFENNVLSANSTFDTTTTRYTNNAGKMLTVTERMVNGQSKYKVTLKEVNKAVESNAKQANSWGYSWSKAWQSFLSYQGVTEIFYQVKHAIGAMIEEVIELDSSLVELQKVTDLEGASLQKFVNDAYKAGETVAKTGTEMVKAATEFAKAGYKDQALELGTIASMYTNIADEEVSAADAAEMLISQMKAFNIEAKDAEHIIDAVNEVSNNFAVSSSDIATNLGKSSAVMANAGNSMEQMIGLMTAGTEITRNASKVANGLKTITLRLQGMTDEGEKDLELMANMESMFNKLGKTVYDSNGSIKNTYDLLGELAEVYPTLTAAEKAYVTETIAGKFQAQNAAAILNNWKTAVDATATALNSQGSAAKENAKVLDSIEGKISKFDSAFQDLSRNIISSDLIKWFVDFGTSVLKIANSDFVKFNAKALAIFGVLKLGKTIITSLVGVISKYSLANSSLVKSLVYLTKGESGLGKYLYNNVAGYKNLTAAEKQKQIQDVATTASTTALNLALSAGALLLTAGISIWQYYKQKQEEAAQSALENAQKTNDEIKSLDDLASQVTSLRETLDNSSSSYKDSKKAREDLISIQEDLIKNYGDEAKGIDLVSGSVDEQIKKLKELKAEYAKEKLKDEEAGFTTAREKVFGKNKYARDIGSVTYTTKDDKYIDDEVKKILNRYGKINNWAKTWTTESVDDSKKALEEWKKYLQDNNEELIKTGKITQEQYDYNIKYIEDELNAIQKKYGTYYDTLEEEKKLQLTGAGFDTFKDELLDLSSTEVLTEENVKKLIESHEGLDEALRNSGYETDKLLDDYQNYDNITKKVADEGTPELKDKLEELSEQTKITEEDFNSLKEVFGDELNNILKGTGMSLDEFIEKFKLAAENAHSLTGLFDIFKGSMTSIEDGFGYLKAAVDEFNDSGYITAETLDKLVDNNLVQYLEFTENGLIANTGALIDSADAAKYKALTDLQAAFAQDALAIATGDTTNASKTAQSIIEGLGGKIDAAGAIAKARAGDMFTYAGSIEAINKAAKGQDISIEGKEEQLKQLVSVYNKYAQSIVATNFAKTKGSYSGSGKSSSSSSKSQKEWWEEQLEALKDQFKYNEITIEEYIGGLDKLLGQVGRGTDAWRKINEELQKQRLTKVEDDYKRGTISLKEYVAQLKELIKAYKQGSDAWNDLADKIKKGLQDIAKGQKDDLDKASDAAIDIIEKEIDKLKDLKDEQSEYYDKLIDDKEKANDETERELELARLQEALANAKNEKVKRVWHEGIGWVWEADQEAIREAQEALDEFNQEEAINALKEEKDRTLENIDAQIDAWEDYKETWESVADDYETAQARMVLAQQLGADAEQDILNQRLNAWEEYKTKYLQTLKEIENLEKTSSTSLAGYNTPTSVSSGSSASSSGSGKTTYTVKSGDTLSGIGSKYGVSWSKIYDANKSVIGGNPNLIRPGQQLVIPGYANGGVVDYTGLAMLHGSKTNPEYVLNNDQVRNLLSNITRPQIIGATAGSSNSVNNYNFGNIELPNVTNAKQFVTELKSLVNITRHQ